MRYTKLKLLKSTLNQNIFILEDDFFEIRNQYFKSFIDSKTWYALPGGIQDNFSAFYKNFPDLKVNQNDLSGYKIDTEGNLDELKEKLLPLISNWEKRDISIDEFTLCPSVTLSLLACYYFARSKNIETIVHETPAFFASVEQAKRLGFENFLIPTTRENDFSVTGEDMEKLNNICSNYALVITQPRVGIGINRRKEELVKIKSHLLTDSILIIDEAADRTYPILRDDSILINDRIFRIKGFFKGLGINGIRASIIYHHRMHKKALSQILEIIGGTMDSYSVMMLSHIAQNPSFFKDCLKYASKQVAENNLIVKTRFMGSKAQFREIENGYLGVVRIPFISKDFLQERNKLLLEAQKLESPLVLGSSMYFPYDGNCEWIRFNLFSRKNNILKSVDVLDELSSIMQK